MVDDVYLDSVPPGHQYVGVQRSSDRLGISKQCAETAVYMLTRSQTPAYKITIHALSPKGCCFYHHPCTCQWHKHKHSPHFTSYLSPGRGRCFINGTRMGVSAMYFLNSGLSLCFLIALFSSRGMPDT